VDAAVIEFSKNALMEIGVKAWEGVRNMGYIEKIIMSMAPSL